MGIGYAPVPETDLTGVMDEITTAREMAVAADDRARRAMTKANAADATGHAAVEATATLDSRLLSLGEQQTILLDLAHSYAAALPASVEDRRGLHLAIEDLTLSLQNIEMTPGPPGPPGKDSVVPGPPGAVSTTPGPPGKDADMTRAVALENAVAALQKAMPMIGVATATLPASLAAGATSTVLLDFKKDLGSMTYGLGYSLAGSATLLGDLRIVSETARTKSTVTLVIKNTGVAALVSLSAGSITAVALRDVI